VEVAARHKELLTSPMGTSCQKATPHEGKLITSFSWRRPRSQLIGHGDIPKMGHLRFEPEQLAMTCLLIMTENGNEPAQEHHGVYRDMIFNGQSKSDYSDPTHAAADASQTNGSRSSETRFGFKATDLIVYPAHGVGQIVAIEEQTVAGASLEFFVVYFAKSKMTLRAPTRKAATAGMRKLSDPGISHASYFSIHCRARADRNDRRFNSTGSKQFRPKGMGMLQLTDMPGPMQCSRLQILRVMVPTASVHQASLQVASCSINPMNRIQLQNPFHCQRPETSRVIRFRPL
jgi:CarD-like/TRCF domain